MRRAIRVLGATLATVAVLACGCSTSATSSLAGSSTGVDGSGAPCTRDSVGRRTIHYDGVAPFFTNSFVDLILVENPFTAQAEAPDYPYRVDLEYPEIPTRRASVTVAQVLRTAIDVDPRHRSGTSIPMAAGGQTVSVFAGADTLAVADGELRRGNRLLMAVSRPELADGVSRPELAEGYVSAGTVVLGPGTVVRELQTCRSSGAADLIRSVSAEQIPDLVGLSDNDVAIRLARDVNLAHRVSRVVYDRPPPTTSPTSQPPQSAPIRTGTSGPVVVPAPPVR